MRISKLIGCCIVALAAIVGVNVHVASVGLSSSTLNVSNVENVAEGWESNNIFDWRGYVKDEYPITVVCRVPYSSNSSYYGTYLSYGQEVYYAIDCKVGNEDCVPKPCQHP